MFPPLRSPTTSPPPALGRAAERVEIVVNRRAGGHAHALAALRALGDLPAGARVHDPPDLAALDAAAGAIAGVGNGADVVVIVGGDGTLSAVLTALARAYDPRPLPAIALIPAGTVNTIAKSWGLRPGGAAAARLLRAVFDGRTRPVTHPTLAARGGPNAADARLGFILGAGLVARFFDLYDAAPSRDLAAAARIAARTALSAAVDGPLARRVLARVRCAIAVDGAPIPGAAYSLILASVVADVGLGLRVAHRAAAAAAADPPRFHLVATGASPPALARALPRALLGRPLGAGAIDRIVSRLEIAFAPPDAPALPSDFAILDGDRLAGPFVRVDAGPRIVTLRPL